MPKAVVYRANSVIYFQGDVGDKVFVLQRGKISLNYSDIENGKDIREVIQMGEFFGVKSAMGHYPREENAVVLDDSSVLIFSVPEFEQFAASNTRIVIKMLKVFSNQLRRIHNQVENLMENPVAGGTEFGLFKTGEYYLRNRMYSQARYVLSRYLTYYPAGKMADQSAKFLEAAEIALNRYGDGKGPSPLPGAGSRPQGGPQGGPQGSPSGGPQAPEQGPANASAAPAPKQASAPKGAPALSDPAKDYYNAVSIFTQEKFKEAFIEFKRLVDTDEESEYTSKAQFDMGRCLYALSQWDATIKHFTGIIQLTPKHPDMADILFMMGQSWDKKGDTERAKGFYKKVLTIPGDEDSSARIKAKKALNALGGA